MNLNFHHLFILVKIQITVLNTQSAYWPLSPGKLWKCTTTWTLIIPRAHCGNHRRKAVHQGRTNRVMLIRKTPLAKSASVLDHLVGDWIQCVREYHCRCSERLCHQASQTKRGGRLDMCSGLTSQTTMQRDIPGWRHADMEVAPRPGCLLRTPSNIWHILDRTGFRVTLSYWS